MSQFEKQEIINQLRLYDTLTIIELLNINSDELVDAFLDKIDERYEEIYEALK